MLHPAGSTTSLARSRQSSRALERASSETVRTSSTSSPMILKGTSPGRPTLIPSAIVIGSSIEIGCPALSEGGYAAAPSACTPMTRTSGRSAFTATATPAARPPPPIPTRMVRTSGHCSRISRPTVPWPAMMSRWSKGWMNTAPVRSAYSWAARKVSSTTCPCRRTSAPYSWVAATFGSGAPTGMNTVERTPRREEASATPCAWLPALAATTPAARCSGSRPAMRT